MAELPLAPVERIMRNAGAKRMSLDALRSAADEVESLLVELTHKAANVAEKDGRMTITSKDISVASKALNQPLPLRQA